MKKKTEQKKPAHRPLKYGEPTVMYRRRVPESLLVQIKEAVEKIVKKKEVS